MSWAALDPGISDGAAFTAVIADCRSWRAAEWDHRWELSGIALLPIGVQNGRVAPNKHEGDYQAESTQSDIGRRNSQIGWGLLATNRPGGSAVATGGRKRTRDVQLGKLIVDCKYKI
jgi:hypothetical protein